MTNNEIRALALSHGFTLRPQPDGSMDLNPYVYEFARALIEQEREACAKVCDKEAVRIVIDSPEERAYNNAVSDCAAAIRARGEK